MKRRSFLGAGVAAAAAGTGACSKRGGGAYWRFFTPDEARVVDALTAVLIPPDQDAGASEAHVVNYIDLQLAKRFRRFQPAYRQGLKTVDESSRRLYGRPFLGLQAQERLAVMEDLEKSNKEFFDLLLNHTRQGYYGDPRHGGNYHMVSWKMVGLPFPSRAWTPALRRSAAGERVMAQQRVNAVIVGAGAGGGVVAKQLSTAGNARRGAGARPMVQRRRVP